MTTNSGETVEGSSSNQQSEEKEYWNNGAVLAFHILLPIAVTAIIVLRNTIITKFQQHFDRNCLSVFCPKFSKREKLLKWTMNHLPYLEGGLECIWKDGSQLCTLINTVVPGACPNPHRHWKKSPTHGQALAYKYLGVVPVFTETDFEERTLTAPLDKRLVEYMQTLQNVISKLSKSDDLTFSNHYIARGMGLVTGEQFRRTILYIYPNCKTKQLENLLINIRGPYNSYGCATLHYENLKKTDENSKQTSENTQKSFFKTLSNDFTNLLTLKNTKEPICNIEIKISFEIERAKVIFIPQNSGVYEVCLTTNGEHIAGSPYNINIEKNRSGITDLIDDIDNGGKINQKRILKTHLEEESIKEVENETEMEENKTEELEENNNELTINQIEAPVRKLEINSNLDAETNKIKEEEEEKGSVEDVCYLLIKQANEEKDKIEKNDHHDSDQSSSTSENWNVIELTPNNDLNTISLVLNNTEIEEVVSNNMNGNVSDVSKGNVQEAQIPEGNDIAIEEPINFRENYLRCKEFWDKLSSPSTSLTSSCVSLTDSTDTTSSSKRFWMNDQPKEERNYEVSTITNYEYRYRSLDFIKQRMKIIRTDSIKDRYGSVDDLNVPSVKERRHLFLHDHQNESKNCNLEKKYSSVSTISINDINIENRTLKKNIGSIHEKIKLFDEGLKKEDEKATRKVNKVRDISSKNGMIILNKDKKLPENGTITTKIKERFHKAHKFFKKLENKNHKMIIKNENLRRHSLGDETLKPKNDSEKGGSLRTTTDNFKVNSIYKNGRVNGNYITSVRNENGNQESGDLQMKFFVNRKRKERKSLQDIFQF